MSRKKPILKLTLQKENFVLSNYSGHCDCCDEFANHLYMYTKKKQYFCPDCYIKATKISKKEG